jgi:hypothetical protein
MTIALDLGAYAMRSLRRRGKELLAHRCRSVAVSLADNAARRNYLQSAKMPILVADGYLVVPGDAALEAAAFFDVVPRDLLPDGEIPAEDPVARQVISAVVEGLLPWSARPQEVCCFTHAGRNDLTDASSAMDRRLQFVSRLIRLRGYEPLPLHPATALVLSELESAGFTGIGLAVGASAFNVAVVHRGMQIACERVARGGSWIDRELAWITKTSPRDALREEVLDLEGARRRKESADLDSPVGDDGRIVADLYRNLIADLLEVLSDLLESRAEIQLLPQPLPIVCGGGPAQIAGFSKMLTGALNGRKFPVALSGPRFVSDHEHTVSRGCLIRAELEQLASSPAPGGSTESSSSAPLRGARRATSSRGSWRG